MKRTSTKPRLINRDDEAEFHVEPLEALEGGLQIDEHALEEELRNQPESFYKVAKAVAIVSSQRDAAKQNLKTVEAEVATQIRQDAIDNDEKVSVAEVEAQTRTHDDYKAAANTLLKLDALAEMYSALKDSFIQRNFALRELSQLYIANYYGDTSGATDRVHDARADHARRDMSRQRKELGRER